MRNRSRISVRSGALIFLIATCAAAKVDVPTLKQTFKGDFVVGAAINEAQITGQDQRGDALIESQFNSISPENALKWVERPSPAR